jgi:hypothetical protein
MWSAVVGNHLVAQSSGIMKAGSKLNLLRWVSPRMIKEAFVTPTDYYPFILKNELILITQKWLF